MRARNQFLSSSLADFGSRRCVAKWPEPPAPDAPTMILPGFGLAQAMNSLGVFHGEASGTDSPKAWPDKFMA